MKIPIDCDAEEFLVGNTQPQNEKEYSKKLDRKSIRNIQSKPNSDRKWSFKMKLKS